VRELVSQSVRVIDTVRFRPAVVGQLPRKNGYDRGWKRNFRRKTLWIEQSLWTVFVDFRRIEFSTIAADPVIRCSGRFRRVSILRAR